ncbi:MAG: class I SAM-dependent methyltransferase [Candidatus Thermoplasmatota archaeon]|nr:class I SAM-dependent methyltransferase [Candidatus Thermoplasmatota archaeon]
MFKTGQKWYREEEIAESYDESRFTGGGKVLDFREKKMLLSLVDPKDKKILDIATGTGRFAEFLSSKGGQVIGLDASREMLMQNEVESIQGDALNLPFKAKAFDITISMRFFHLLDQKKIKDFVLEVERVTKDKFVFESLHPLSLRILYQWALPQGSSLYSNSLLKKKFSNLAVIKEVNFYPKFIIPYGFYQSLPLDIGEKVNELDEKISENQKLLASTVYWELYFED